MFYMFQDISQVSQSHVAFAHTHRGETLSMRRLREVIC